MKPLGPNPDEAMEAALHPAARREVKIVYNACFGGFGLSREAILRYAAIKGLTLWEDESDLWGSKMTSWYTKAPDQRKNENDGYFRHRDIPRTDPALVQVVEELGDAASSPMAELAIRSLPAGSKYRIDEYDGSESVMTPDDYEWEIAE